MTYKRICKQLKNYQNYYIDKDGFVYKKEDMEYIPIKRIIENKIVYVDIENNKQKVLDLMIETYLYRKYSNDKIVKLYNKDFMDLSYENIYFQTEEEAAKSYQRRFFVWLYNGKEKIIEKSIIRLGNRVDIATDFLRKLIKTKETFYGYGARIKTEVVDYD